MEKKKALLLLLVDQTIDPPSGVKDVKCRLGRDPHSKNLPFMNHKRKVGK